MAYTTTSVPVASSPRGVNFAGNAKSRRALIGKRGHGRWEVDHDGMFEGLKLIMT